MINKKPFKSFSTGTLAAIGLTVTGLYSQVNAEEQKTEAKPLEKTIKKADSHSHHKMKEGMCGSHMQMDMDGMVMHANTDNLPKDCTEVSEDITIQVKAGTKYAEAFPGTVFGFNEHQWNVNPCSRITVEFVNEDEIRHQWMVHGLPTYLYPKGMFHIEANGQTKRTGTFIVPSSHYTYLVHCDIAQHMEKGMKAQLVVGNGRKDLTSIPGISNPKYPDTYP